MKNLFKKYTGILSFLSILLILPIHYAYSQNVDELFGIKLLDNATKYVSSEYIENNKYKHSESITGFWSLKITSNVSSPYFERFTIHIDDYNKIHTILGAMDYNSKDRCVTFLENLKETVETKKKIEFEKTEDDYGLWMKTMYFNRNDNIFIQCNHTFDPVEDKMIYYVMTEEIIVAIRKYYNQD